MDAGAGGAAHAAVEVDVGQDCNNDMKVGWTQIDRHLLQSVLRSLQGRQIYLGLSLFVQDTAACLPPC